MANVLLKGVFMGASVKTTEFEGNKKSKVIIDIYQPDSESSEKSVSITTDQVDMITSINKDFSTGSVFTCEANVTAYKNKAYYKLKKIVS